MAVAGAAEDAAGTSLFKPLRVEPLLYPFQPNGLFRLHNPLNYKHYTHKISVVNAAWALRRKVCA